LYVNPAGDVLGQHVGVRFDGLAAAFPLSLARENFLLPSGTVMRKSACERIGGFMAERFYAADWDYYLRGVAAGLRFVFSPEETVLYRKHSEAATTNFVKMAISCIYVLRKNLPRMDAAMQAEMQGAIHHFLGRLIYMKVSFRDWSFFSDFLSAMKLKPLSPIQWKSVAKGFRNNWHKLETGRSDAAARP
jgi:hypothetical protein